MIIKLLVKSAKIFVIWLIIGVIVAAAYKHIKPYCYNAIPGLKGKIAAVQPIINNLTEKVNLKKISNAVVDKTNAFTNKISESTKSEIRPKSTKPILAALPSPSIGISSQKEEIIDRQLSLLNELMK